MLHHGWTSTINEGKTWCAIFYISPKESVHRLWKMLISSKKLFLFLSYLKNIYLFLPFSIFQKGSDETGIIMTSRIIIAQIVS